VSVTGEWIDLELGMRIGIDGTCWLNRRGYGRFARELVSRLVALNGGAEYTLVVDFDPAEAPEVPPGIRVLPVVTRQPAARAAAASGRRSLADMWATSRAISREGFDVIFFPSAYTYVPVTGSGRVVVVLHDVIAEQFPEHVFPTRLAAMLWWLKLLAARRQADLVMTVSEASRKGISDRFGIPRDRIVVVPEAADAMFRPLPPDDTTREVLQRFAVLDRRFILYVGGISPHKNIGTLLDAFAQLRRDPACSDCRLLLVGDFTGDVFYSAYDELRRRSESLGLGDAVRFTGYVADDDLVRLYAAAEVFVLPSLLEGFGLPAIEAMACGAPVVASCRGALPEVIGPAGLLFDPDRAGDLHDVLRRVLTDAALRERLRRLGPQRAAEFSWDRAAQRTLSVFRSLANGSPMRGVK
jgi:glycosyltransferase involved in cell wall biosynthesis